MTHHNNTHLPLPGALARNQRVGDLLTILSSPAQTGRPCEKIHSMDDAVARYRTASDASDIDGLIEALAPDVEVVSPISGRMVFRGRDDVRVLLGAVYSTITDLRWQHELGDERLQVVLGEARVGPLRLTDAMVCELDEDGRIRRISPHLRPWLPLTLFALLLGPKVARHPGVIVRALRRG